MYPQLLVALVLSPIWLTDASDYCEPFGHYLHNDCDYSHLTYQRIRDMFHDVLSGHHSPKPVIYLLIQVYRFAHRCASKGEAAFNIFHPHDIHVDFDVAYDTEYEPTWIRLTDELFDNDPHYPHDNEHLHDEMEWMMQGHGGPGCLTAILNHYGGLHTREVFFHYYPEVHQTAPPPTTTSTHSPAVTTPTHATLDCDHFDHHLQDDCDYQQTTYQRVHQIFQYASSGHHSPKPVIYRLIQLYRFAHRCASRGEAAFNIFKPQIDSVLKPAWIRLTNEQMHRDLTYPDHSEELHHEMQLMIQGHGGGPGCLTAIINEFGGASSRQEFFSHYTEDFLHKLPRSTTTSTHTIATTTPTTTPTPTTIMATTTTPTTTPTTTTAATTSPATTDTTTTTTTTPTTTPTPTSTSPATTTAASATSASTAMGYACTVCDTLECLLHAHRRQCAHNEPYCLTTVKDTVHGRAITRSCADSQRCPGGLIMPDARCAKVEESSQEPGTTCHYCCSGHDCNAPPNLFPPTGFVGFGNGYVTGEGHDS